ncbi:Kcnj6, partial [Symbiodinium necroappetens]
MASWDAAERSDEDDHESSDTLAHGQDRFDLDHAVSAPFAPLREITRRDHFLVQQRGKIKRILDRDAGESQSTRVYWVRKKRKIYAMFFYDFFHTILQVPVLGVYPMVFISYALCHLLFAIMWWSISDSCAIGLSGLMSAFYFSVETQMTIGYGAPAENFAGCPEAVLLLPLQVVCGQMLDAAVIGIVFAQISAAPGLQMSSVPCCVFWASQRSDLDRGPGVVAHFWYVDMYVFNVDAHLYPPSGTLSHQLRRQMIKLSMLNIVSGKEYGRLPVDERAQTWTKDPKVNANLALQAGCGVGVDVFTGVMIFAEAQEATSCLVVSGGIRNNSTTGSSKGSTWSVVGLKFSTIYERNLGRMHLIEPDMDMYNGVIFLGLPAEVSHKVDFNSPLAPVVPAGTSGYPSELDVRTYLKSSKYLEILVLA